MLQRRAADRRQRLSDPIPVWRPAASVRDGVPAQVSSIVTSDCYSYNSDLLRTPAEQDKGYVSVVSTEEFNNMQQNGFQDEEEMDFTPQNGYHDAEVDIERVNSKGK